MDTLCAYLSSFKKCTFLFWSNRDGNFLSFFQKHWGKRVRRSDAYGDFLAQALLSKDLVAVSG